MLTQEYLYDWTWTGYNPVSAGWQECAPGHSFGPGIREFYTIHYVLSGTGTYKVKGRQFQVQPGELFAFSPFETVFYQADTENPWHYVWINFVINGQVPYMFEQPVVSAPFLEPLFRDIVRYPHHDTQGRAFISQCLWQIARELSPRQEVNALLVDSTVRYIQRHYSNPDLSVAEIASQLGVSRYTLSEAFSKGKKVSVISYLIHFRLEKACEYMSVQGVSPSVAARSVGYGNYTHFTRIFKKYYGISPREYQRRASHSRSTH